MFKKFNTLLILSFFIFPSIVNAGKCSTDEIAKLDKLMAQSNMAPEIQDSIKILSNYYHDMHHNGEFKEAEKGLKKLISLIRVL